MVGFIKTTTNEIFGIATIKNTCGQMLLRVSNEIPPLCGKNLRVFHHRDVKLEEVEFLTTPSKTFTCLK